MKSGCVYCHARAAAVPRPAAGKKRGRSTPMAEKMNDRMTALKRRLKEIRGE
jgi:hypothetical protein